MQMFRSIDNEPLQIYLKFSDDACHFFVFLVDFRSEKFLQKFVDEILVIDTSFTPDLQNTLHFLPNGILFHVDHRRIQVGFKCLLVDESVMFLGILDDIVGNVEQCESMRRFGLFHHFEPGFDEMLVLRMMVEDPERESLNAFLCAVDEGEALFEAGRRHGGIVRRGGGSHRRMRERMNELLFYE